MRTFESKIIHVGIKIRFGRSFETENGDDDIFDQTPSQMRIENCLKSNAPILAFEMFEN